MLPAILALIHNHFSHLPSAEIWSCFRWM